MGFLQADYCTRCGDSTRCAHDGLCHRCIQADHDRYKEALEQVCKHHPCEFNMFWKEDVKCPQCVRILEIAKQALNLKEKK